MNCLQQFIDYVYRFPDCNSIKETLEVLKIHIEYIKGNDLEFDIIGLKPFVVNAIRQTILNDVPTMAIEDVYFYKNSSIFNCDYVAQRLSGIPIKANPDDFKFVYNNDMEFLNSDNTIVLNLNAKNTGTQPTKVYSNSLTWEPIGETQKKLSNIEPLFGKIPILYLKANEEISCKIHCIKGKGRTHMKFCPGFAKYCFFSKIDIINKNLNPELALLLKNSFPSGVIELETKPNEGLIPYVSKPRLDRHSRSFKNNENIEKSIEVKYYRDHVIVNVESYGVLEPVRMVVNALDIMCYKYNYWKETIENIKSCSQKYTKNIPSTDNVKI